MKNGNLDKIKILNKVMKILSDDLNLIEDFIQKTNNLINDAPGAMQSHSDTTRLQLTSVVDVSNQSFLNKSKGLQLLKVFSRENLNSKKFEEIKNGAFIITKKENGNIENYFFIPYGSGIKIEEKNYKITCITSISPLGKTLFLKKKGETILFNKQKIEILNII